MKHPGIDLRIAALGLIALGAAACRRNPCGDSHGTLPPTLAPLSTALPDANVCHATPTSAMMMVWGGTERMHALAAHALATLPASGWSQEATFGYSNPDAPTYSFSRGAEGISLTFRVGQTPRFGSKMLADSVTIHAHYGVSNRRIRY